MSERLTREEAEEYTQALGQVVAGGWRQVALAKRLGVPQTLGLGVDDWVETRLGGYVRMSIPERREAVAELTEEGMSTREIGAVLGVGKSTVADDRDAAVQERTPEPEGPRTDEPNVEASVQDRTPEPDHSAADAYIAEMAEADLTLQRARACKKAMHAITSVSSVASELEAIAEALIHDRDYPWEESIERSMETLSRLREAVTPAGLRRIK